MPCERIGALSVEYLDAELLRFLVREIFAERAYHFPSARRRPYILDCGSNIGVSVLYFKQLHPHARIHAFEPDALAFRCLAANVARNRLHGVTLHECALALEEGEVDFYYDPAQPGALVMSTVRERMPVASRRVRAEMLSAYVDRPVDYLKIDIEGGEADVLAELEAAGKFDLVRRIGVEYHHHIVPGEDRFGEFLARFERHGFGYHLGTRRHPPRGRGRFQDILVHAYRKRRAPAKIRRAPPSDRR